MTPYQQEYRYYRQLDIEAAKQETIEMIADDIQEEAETLLYVGGDDEKANEIIEEILVRNWDEFINLMRVAIKSRNKSSDIWYQFFKKEIESYADDSAIAQFDEQIALHREDGTLRKFA